MKKSLRPLKRLYYSAGKIALVIADYYCAEIGLLDNKVTPAFVGVVPKPCAVESLAMKVIII
jgi:hypothetical protein